MKYLAFTLTMPNSGSWNGKWSGADNVYARVRTYKDSNFNKSDLVDKRFCYSWNDGWTACVEVKLVNAVEKNKLLKQSKGFYGYDWMIDNIMRNKKIVIGE